MFRSEVFLRTLFDVHVFEFAGFEDLAAILALDELGIFIAAHNLNAKMFARLLRLEAWRSGGRLGRHNPALLLTTLQGSNFWVISGHCKAAQEVVKSFACKRLWILLRTVCLGRSRPAPVSLGIPRPVSRSPCDSYPLIRFSAHKADGLAAEITLS
jgi:hypothetical protein